ncbi:MAG: leucyl-tRNA synthetase [Candidatus Parcubacteria bacterium]|jgi:8-oxo-dGTP pyrophosphatase MutT (NUDIX family)
MTQDIPYFEDLQNPVRPDKRTVERNMAQAIVWDKSKNVILCMHWPELGWKTLVLGGVEEGEDMVEAAKREIAEETGYMDVKFICEVGQTKGAFFAINKDENRISNGTGLLFELITEARREVDEAETKKHGSHWIPVDEVMNFVNIEAQQYMLKKAFEKMI